ncbi:glycosyltransferase family 4 protein [Candidatus Woesebacteria bacterium]|nr:MAG: glycosyltransferase family 4 protein [Candidatus Woesebacteria bacterium]
MSEIFYYSKFSNFNIIFAGDSSTGWIVKSKIPSNISFVDLKLKPRWGWDPVTSILGKSHVHRSWQISDQLDKYIKTADIVNISDTFYFYCGQSANYCRKYGKKLVPIVWETVPKHLSTYLPPYSWNVRSVLANSNHFVARSIKAKKYLESIGVGAQKITVVYKGIDTHHFKPVKRPKGRIRFLYVGQLIKEKGLVELIEAFEMLARERNDIELFLAGKANGGPLTQLINDKKKTLPLIVKSEIEYHKMNKVYQDADIYCHLSQDWRYAGLFAGGNDWFPYAVIEAMATGLPVVSTGVGGIPEQLGNMGNIIVKQKNILDTYNGMKKILDDEKLRRKLALLNRDRAVKMFNIKKQAAIQEKIFLQVISKHTS